MADGQVADDEGLDEAITFADFALPPPEPLDQADKEEVLTSLMERIWTNGAVLADLPDDITESDGLRPVVQSKEMWMLLLARLATRGDVGRSIEEFVTADFASR
jgi:symplekin